MEHLFDVIAEDDDLLVINKPAGLVCHPTKGDVYSSLISRARLYLESAEAHLINRLDRETSGIVIIAKRLEVGAHLRRVWQAGLVHKEYRALVHGRIHKGMTIEAPLGPDRDSRVAIKDCVLDQGSPATTLVFPLSQFFRHERWFSLVRVVLVTGRKHQIRLHLSHVGHPIVGDKLYGGDENIYLDFVQDRLTPSQRAWLMTENHCLHAEQVCLEWLAARRCFYCRPEPWFTHLVQRKGAG